METGQNKALMGNMRGEGDELFSKDSTPTKDVITTVNMTKIPHFHSWINYTSNPEI